MRKRLLLTILFLLATVNADAITVSTYFNYGVGSTVTDVNLNGNFDNIRNVINGGLDNTNTATGYKMVEVVSSLPAAGNQGRVVFLTADNTLYFDTGASFVTVPSFTASHVQGDLLYSNGTNFSLLNKSTTESHYLSNQGASNNPLWEKIDLVTGTQQPWWSGQSAGDLLLSSTPTSVARLPVGVSGQVLKVINGLPAWSTASSVSVFTSDGTFIAPAGITSVVVTLVGGGGGGGALSGGSGGGGGGGGATIIDRPYTVVPGNSYVVDVGAKGAGGSSGSAGSAGAASTFDSSLSAAGGSGGNGGGTGGAGGGTQLNGSGATAGGGSFKGGNGGDQSGGTAGGGGGTPFGAGTNGASNPSDCSSGYGGGGGGVNAGGTDPGGDGCAGVVIVSY